MTRICSIAALAAVLALAGMPAGAFMIDGNKLYDACTGKETYDRTFCLGYVSGVHDTLDGFTADTGGKYCVPRTVSSGQLADLITKFLRDNPGRRRLAAARIVGEAITRTFPCP